MLTAVPVLQASVVVLAYIAFTLWCYRGPITRRLQRQQGGKILVAYASESGTAARLAEHLHQQLQQQGDAAGCLTLNAIQPAQLQNVRQLLIIASTSGDGEAPDNGRFFLRRLTAGAAINHLQFAVLALGDRDYPQYCVFGLHLQQQLENAGAQPLFAPVLVNRNDPQALRHWQQQLRGQGVLNQTADIPDSTTAADSHWTLHKRQWLNPGSPGDPVYHLELQPQHNEQPSAHHWQAGDIARLHLNDQTRDYTIASVPDEGCLRLLVREHHHPDGTPGLGSGWLCHGLSAGGQTRLSIRSNPAFHAPEPHRPLILIGNGTGLAGLRAHLKQREQHGSHTNWLIYGERSPAHDRPWHTELQHWQDTGHLTQLDLAYSRHEEHQPWPHTQGRMHRGYVQQALHQHAHDLQHWITQGAAIYLCGSRNGMAHDVEQSLNRLLGEHTVQQLTEQGRYRRDVY